MVFVYIGAHLKIADIDHQLPQILLFTLAIILVKVIVSLCVFVYMRLHSRPALHLSLSLFQLSENAFLLLSIAYANGIFSHDEFLLLLTVVLLSIILTPFIIDKKDIIYLYVRAFLKRYIPAVELFVKYRIDHSYIPLEQENREDHVIICGYGRVGSYIGRALMLADIPFAAVDYNFQIANAARKEGIDMLYGDPTDFDILKSLQVEKASAIVCCLPDIYAQENIVIHAKKLNSRIVIISNVHRRDYVQRIRDLGADIVIQEEYEASISIIKKLFVIKDLPKQDIINKVRHF